jgi:hypothetical protein
MSKNIKLACTCLVAILVLCFVSLSCSKPPVTVTLPVVTTTVPVTQTLTTTSTVNATTINTVTITNPTTITATATAPPVTVTTTIVPPPVTTTKPPMTITQYWPPVTKLYMEAYYYYLPPLAKGQTVNFTLNNSGSPLSYWVRDPATNLIISGKMDSVTLSYSSSFTAAISGTYSIECVPAEGLPTVFSLSFSIS